MILKGKARKIISLFLVLNFLFSPLFASAQSFQDIAKGAGKGLINCGVSSGISALGGIFRKVKNKIGGDAVPISNDKIEESTDKTKEKVTSMEKKEKCLDAIAYETAKAVIANIAKNNLGWVGSGNNGNPLYITNQRNYFSGIKNQEVERIAKNLINKKVSPYAKNSLKNILSEYLPFEEKIKPTLNQSQLDSFQNDFSNGGWQTFTEFTKSQNNPVGSYILTREHLAKEAKAKKEESTNELNWNNGFLSKKEDDCDSSDPDCAVDTPGSIILDQTKVTLSSPIRQLEQADELSEVLSQLFTSLTNQLINKGFDSISGSKGYSSGDKPWFDEDNGILNIDEGGDDLSGVDLKKEIDSILEDQKSLIAKFNEHNVIIENIILKIRELDFCIPGPRPDWEEPSREKISLVVTNYLKYFPGTVTANGKDFLEKYIGVKGVIQDDKVVNRNQIETIVNKIFDQYRKYIEKRYTLTPSNSSVGLPAVAKTAKDEYAKIADYYADIEQNKENIVLINDTIIRLEKIRAIVKKADVSEEEYNKQFSIFLVLAPQIASKDSLRSADETKTELNGILENIKLSIDLCLEETRNSNYGRPTERLPYPYSIDRHGIVPSKSFLPQKIYMRGEENNENLDPFYFNRDFGAQSSDYETFEKTLEIY